MESAVCVTTVIDRANYIDIIINFRLESVIESLLKVISVCKQPNYSQ